ncbi:MAG: hypothetical protein JO209_01520 [Acidisphaera sp.]|nr:hypothetical protein [Acidisphaera sp.]
MIDVDAFGLARDGRTDDSARFQAAIDAAMARTGRLYIGAGGPILLTDAFSASLHDVAIAGDGVRDIGESGVYGHAGSQIWITGRRRSPFLLGGAVSFEGVNFFWPGQTEAACAGNGGEPIAYPPLFGQQDPPAQVNRFDFVNCQVTNCYDFLVDTGNSGGAVLGAVNLERCHIYAVRNCLTLQLVPEVVLISDTLFSWGAYQNEVNPGATHHLRDFSNARGCWLKVVGDGTGARFPSTQVQGIKATNCYVYGPAKGIWCAGGCLGLSTLIGVGFDAVPTVLQVDPGGSLVDFRFLGGKWYPLRIASASGADTTAIVIRDPAPGYPLQLSCSGLEIPFIDGSLAAISGDAVGLVSFSDLRCGAIGHTGGGRGPYDGLAIDARNAELRVALSDFAPQNPATAGTALRIGAAALVSIVNNVFRDFTVAVDIGAGVGTVTLDGNTSLRTRGKTSVTGAGAGRASGRSNNWDRPG